MSPVARTAPHVVLRRASFAHPSSPLLLDAIDLSLHRGWTALVGANGAGKTTLLRLLLREITPSTGAIEWPDGARVVSCTQSIDDVLDPSFGERVDRVAQRVRERLRLDPSTLDRWASLSPGERRRWQIGSALAAEPDVLLLDEPTNHLDREGRAHLIDALRAFRGIGVLVSHDRALLDALTHTTVRIDAGRARAWSGSYSTAREAWEAEARALGDRREQLRSEVRRAERALDQARREHDSAERGRSTSARMKSKHDSDARTLGASTRAMWAEAGAGRAVARRHGELDRARTALASLEPTTRSRGRSLFVDFQPSTRRVVLALDRPTISAGDRVLLCDVRLSLGRADRVRLTGPNGAGKTTLLGELLRDASDPRIVVIPQVITRKDTTRRIADLRALSPDTRGRAVSLLAALGADGARLLATGEASPGEARQLAVASALLRGAHTLVLDEPTNDLDLPAIERLEDALAAFPGALLVVTHDDALAERLGLSEWRIENERVIAR